MLFYNTLQHQGDISSKYPTHEQNRSNLRGVVLFPNHATIVSINQHNCSSKYSVRIIPLANLWQLAPSFKLADSLQVVRSWRDVISEDRSKNKLYRSSLIQKSVTLKFSLFGRLVYQFLLVPTQSAHSCAGN